MPYVTFFKLPYLRYKIQKRWQRFYSMFSHVLEFDYKFLTKFVVNDRHL
jgi:hypothetical protein